MRFITFNVLIDYATKVCIFLLHFFGGWGGLVIPLVVLNKSTDTIKFYKQKNNEIWQMYKHRIGSSLGRGKQIISVLCSSLWQAQLSPWKYQTSFFRLNHYIFLDMCIYENKSYRVGSLIKDYGTYGLACGYWGIYAYESK